MLSLAELASRPPDGDGERNIVLSRYHEIRAARLNGWGWTDIAASLERNPRALAAAFHRVETAIKRGKLDSAKLGGKARSATVRSAAPAPAARSNFTDLTVASHQKFGDATNE